MQIDGVGAAQPKGAGASPKAVQTSAQKPAQEGDQVSLNQPPKWAQRLIQQALQFSLAINGQHYQAPKSQEFKLEPVEEITPETLFDYQSVADNVLQFVTGRLGAARADGKSDEDLAEMMVQARKGVDMGFGGAREQLGSWADNEDIKTGMDQSYKLIQEGLESFEKEFFGQLSPTELGDAEMASRRQGALEIETRDGDKLILRFSDSWQFKSRHGEEGNQFSLASSQGVDLSVEGEFGGSEIDAIIKLVKGLDDLASHFFNGDGSTLADKLSGLPLDDSQLAAYSLKLRQSSRLSQTYQGAHSLQESLKPLADYLPRLSQWQQQADALLPASQQQALTPVVLAARGQNDAALGAGFMGFNQRMLEASHLLGQQMATG